MKVGSQLILVGITILMVTFAPTESWAESILGYTTDGTGPMALTGFEWQESYTRGLVFAGLLVGVIVMFEVLPNRSVQPKDEIFESVEKGPTVAGYYYNSQYDDSDDKQGRDSDYSDNFSYSKIEDFESPKKYDSVFNSNEEFKKDDNFESDFDEDSWSQINKSSQTSDLKIFYEILGVTENATPTEIKKARDKMVLCWHPDKNKSSFAESIVMKTNIAYGQLKKAGRC